eukprot:SAG31_NODE_4159_length_3524_cov_2.556788_5_plen_81_part_00
MSSETVLTSVDKYGFEDFQVAMMSASVAGQQAQDESVQLMLEEVDAAITGQMPARKMAARIKELEAALKACTERVQKCEL